MRLQNFYFWEKSLLNAKSLDRTWQAVLLKLASRAHPDKDNYHDNGRRTHIAIAILTQKITEAPFERHLLSEGGRGAFFLSFSPDFFPELSWSSDFSSLPLHA